MNRAYVLVLLTFIVSSEFVREQLSILMHALGIKCCWPMLFIYLITIILIVINI